MHHPKTIRRINDEAAERERKQAAVRVLGNVIIPTDIGGAADAVLKVADDFAPRLFEATPA